MRTGWKVLGGTGAAGVLVAVLIVAQTRRVRGDTASTATGSEATTPDTGPPRPDPNKPFPEGPETIRYEQLSEDEKKSVDLIRETLETSQPASSHQAWAAATAWTGQQAAAEIAARSVGLTGTAEDGVVP